MSVGGGGREKGKGEGDGGMREGVVLLVDLTLRVYTVITKNCLRFMLVVITVSSRNSLVHFIYYHHDNSILHMR